MALLSLKITAPQSSTAGQPGIATAIKANPGTIATIRLTV